MEPEVKSLGTANGWQDTPEIVVKCREAGHHLKYKKLGRCYSERTCPLCKYSYCVDSSD